MAELKDIVSSGQLEALNEAGFHTLEDVVAATAEQLSAAHGFGEARSAELVEEARTALMVVETENARARTLTPDG